MTIAFLTLIDELCMFVYTPARIIPNKSHLGEGLRAFPTRGNHHPLSLWNNEIVSGMTYSYLQQMGGILRTEFLPHWYFSEHQQ